MAPILYMYHGSPACRVVLIVAKAINLEMDIRVIARTPECPFTTRLKEINPKATVPTLEDNEIILSDSHAINCYLIDKYCANDNLYPKEVGKRALVNDKLFFNIGVLFADLHHLFVMLIYKEVEAVPKKYIENICKSYSILEKYLETNLWVCGTEMTLADLTIYTTLTSLNRLVRINESNNPKIIDWLHRISILPYMTSDRDELAVHFKFVDGLLQQ